MKDTSVSAIGTKAIVNTKSEIGDDTVDGLGRPVNKEDIRIQMFGTVYYVPKEDVIPIGWIEKKRDELDNNNGYASYIIDWLIEEWEEEQRIKNNGN